MIQHRTPSHTPLQALRPILASVRRQWCGLAMISTFALSLSACGGGGQIGPESSQASAPLATGMTVLTSQSPFASPTNITYDRSTIQPTDATEGATDIAQPIMLPLYHLAPVLPPLPSDVDRDGHGSSAQIPPATRPMPASVKHMSTRALTVEQVSRNSYEADMQPQAGGSGTGKQITTYTPAQIRAAYGLPPVPTNLTGITALQAAQMGAGQTIYIIDAQHDLYAYGELLAFSQLFGLPACANKALATNATLPLPAPTPNTCEFYQIYSTPSGGMTNTAPLYDTGWATEIALDVQWAHAIAPLARIVLIEAPAASLDGLSGAVQLANSMGPGIVSMSFGGTEGSYVSSMDSRFQANGMSYFAATGDNGAGVGWPAVSPFVVAVGGTSLSYSSGGTRSETAWSLTGGGISNFVATPAYQKVAVPGLSTSTHRSVADVSFNADPNTGQFVAVIPSQTTCSFCQVSWVTGGGTSLATPQWAGIAAIANAMRVQAGKTLLGDPHNALYSQIAASNSYATNLADITLGSNGSCSTCRAGKGYDTPTGLGSPNAQALLNTLAANASGAYPPIVIGSTINGAWNQTLSFTASVSSSNPVTLSLVSAPAGMTVSANAVVSWPNPVPGTTSVTVVAKDSKTGLSGQGNYSIVISAPPPPGVSSGNINATSGKPLSFSVGIGDVNPCALTLLGAPQGMTISSSGVVTWSNPVTGNYVLGISAKDSKTGASGQGTYTVSVSPAQAPVVSSASVSARSGVPFNFALNVSNSNPVVWSMNNAPVGMSLSPTGTLTWSNPLTGTYPIIVTAKDSKTGVAGLGMIMLKVGAGSGPAVYANTMSGIAGKPFAATINITDGSASIVALAVGGTPQGMSVIPGFSTTSVNWSNPVAGNYTLYISTTDSQQVQSTYTLPLTIAAH